MSLPGVLARKARSFLRLPLFSVCWLVPVWCLLGFAKAAIFTISFRRLAPALGVSTGAAPWVPLLTGTQRRRASQIGRAIRLAARYTPWESNCLPQAVAARVLLGLYGVPYTLFFGVAREPEQRGIRAHAWVSAGPVAVTGSYSFRSFTVVGVFASPGMVTA